MAALIEVAKPASATPPLKARRTIGDIDQPCRAR